MTDDTKERFMKLKASFTVEASFVMSIIFFCLITAILFAYSTRDRVFKNYISSQAAVDAAYTEEKWKPAGSTLEKAEEHANSRLHTIGRYSSSMLSVSRDELQNNAYANIDDEIFTARIIDIENYMRITSVIQDFTKTEGNEHE